MSITYKTNVKNVQTTNFAIQSVYRVSFLIALSLNYRATQHSKPQHGDNITLYRIEELLSAVICKEYALVLYASSKSL